MLASDQRRGNGMELKRILCAVDFADAEHPAVEYAKMLADISGGSILVLHVIPTRSVYEHLGLVAKEVDKHMAAHREDSRNKMDAFLHEHFPGKDISSLTCEGNPAEAIVNIAKNKDMDIIVMGTHGHEGFNKLFFGSVANEVIRTADCPVLTIRPEHV